MAQKTAAAWVTYFDDIRCLEASTASKAAWLKSLYLGCLNKSVGEKLKVYSHLRSLSSKVDIPLPSEETRSRRFTLHIDNSEVEIDDQAREQKEVEDSKHRALSLVILEDNSRPPEATEEVSPLLFTPTAFFNYVYSGDWGGYSSIRIINGELLQLLLAALCSLEMQFLVDSNIVYANLNNRLKVGLQKDKQKQNVFEKATKRVQAHFPNTYTPNREFVYEQMNVEIVFYEKAEVSNIPYVIRDYGNSDNVTQMTMQRDISRYPYALNHYEIDYVRLPASEDVDIKSTLHRLKAELNELKAAELPPKEISAPGRFPEKENAVAERVEWIADDPYLVPENRVKMNTSGAVTSAKESPTALNSPLLRTSSQAIPDPERLPILTEEEIILNEILSHISKNYSVHDLDEEEEHVSVQSIQSSEGSYVIISSPSQFMKKEKEEPTQKRLYLTRRELYIAGLYSPRKENSACLEDKLQRTRQKRFAHRLAKETSIYGKLQENLPFNINDRFKCLASAKSHAKKKAPGPQISKKAEMKKLSLPGTLSLWENYSKGQENMEMETALINDVEREVLNRLSENKKQRTETEPDVRSKGTRNKSKNNPDEIDSSPIRSNRVKPMSTNQQISKNINTNAKTTTGNHYEASMKHKLPYIDSKTKKETHVSENNNKLSVTLPLLFQRENQDQHKKSRKYKNNCTCNKEIIRGPRTDKLGNQTWNRNSKNKKHSKRHMPKLEMIREETSGGKDIFHNSDKESILLHSRQSQENSNHNKNQNNLTGNNQEDEERVDETDDEEEDKEAEVNAAPQEAISGQESLADRDKNEVKYVDSYNEKLEQFCCQCSCEECICLTEALSCETRDTHDATYPMILGRMRRDFKFLKCANYEPKSVSTCADSHFNLPKLTHQTVCDHLLKLMENVLVRKEILTSSLGYKYITITFTKPDTSKK